MAVVAAGVRYDPVNRSIQAVIVITDDDGLGHVDHLKPHKLHAAHAGHAWIDIPAHVYESFKHREDLEAHVAAQAE